MPDPLEISLVEETPAMCINQTLFFHDHVGDKKSVFLQRDAGPPLLPALPAGCCFKDYLRHRSKRIGYDEWDCAAAASQQSKCCHGNCLEASDPAADPSCDTTQGPQVIRCSLKWFSGHLMCWPHIKFSPLLQDAADRI